MGENSSALGSIPSMECLRSITSLAHLSLLKHDHGLPSAQDRVRDLSKQYYSGCGLTRSSTAIEHSDTSGRCGFDSHRERQFRRAVEFGLSVKRVTASGFESRPSRQDGWVPNSFFVRRRFRAGPLHFGYRTGSSTAPEHPVQTGRCGFDTRPETSKLSLVCPFIQISLRRVAGLGYRSRRRGRGFESRLRLQTPE